MFCRKCGTQLKDGVKFCPKCGQSVAQGGALQPSGGPAANPAPNGMPSGFGAKVPPAGEPQKKVKAGHIAVIVALCVVILCMGGALGWLLLGQRSSDEAQLASSVQMSDEDDKKEEKSEKEQDDAAGSDKDAADADAKTEAEADDAADKASALQEEPVEAKDVDIEIHQVDNTKFPEVTFYASVVDPASSEAVEGLKADDFQIQEFDHAGKVISTTLKDVQQVVSNGGDPISMDLVLDVSGSMDDASKIDQAKNAAKALVDTMKFDRGDQIEVISFDDYVYLNQEFTSDASSLKSAIGALQTGDSTALYDALYAGLRQTYEETGVKCVVGFTDGEENASSYTYSDVVELSRNTGIPVYIIGIGDEYDASTLQSLAKDCSGEYFSSSADDLEDVLSRIYLSIYENQQDYYIFKYTSKNKKNKDEFRTIQISTAEDAPIIGSYEKEYVPEADVSGNFSMEYANIDQILDFTSTRAVTDADLSGLSLAELRIARNEIFARHGRQFKDPFLNQWFYSKEWYLNLPHKYSPEYFDANQPDPLSKLEAANADYIRKYEVDMMSYNDIYPNACNVLLSDYDLALSKADLKRALSQVKNYTKTNIRDENIKRIQNAINQDEIQY